MNPRNSDSLAQAMEAAFALHGEGRHEEAAAACRSVLAVLPQHVDALHILGVALIHLGQSSEAVEPLKNAVRGRLSDPVLRNALGTALMEAGQLAEAEKAYRRALKLRPGFADALSNLGRLLHTSGRTAEAEQSFRRALLFEPKNAWAHVNLGFVLIGLGREAEAEQSCRQAILLHPQFTEAHGNLGLALMRLGRTQEAERSWRHAISLGGPLAPVHDNLAKLLAESGRLEEAEQSYRQAIALAPDWPSPQQGLAMLLNFIPERPPAELHAAHRELGRRFFHREDSPEYRNNADSERPLRIGYVSPDLRKHSVASFLEPVLARHDKRELEITCYYNNFSAPDATTQRLKTYADRWRDVPGLDDEALAALIAADGIDLLVDLAGPTLGDRLGVFARRPAPVQITWLGYPTITGCPAIGFRITDPHVDDPSESEPGAEKPVRLPGSYFCYSPPRESIDPGPLPAQAAGHITFGSFNALKKVNPAIVALWSRVLLEVPGARLILKAKGLTKAATRARLTEWFERQGVAAARLAFFDSQKEQTEHLAFYRKVDVALDTYPYNGATTTCEALWMGVPVVSLSGRTHASRMGKSILHAAGLGELVAADEEAFVRAGVALSANVPQLAAMRASLRARMMSSALTDAERFTRQLEQAYRTLWRGWCASQKSRPV